MIECRSILCTVTLLFTASQISHALPHDSRRAGGIAVIPLPADVTTLRYHDQPIMTVTENAVRYAILGIPLSTEVGTLQLATNSAPITVEVQPYHYPEQRLMVKNQAYVEPDAKQLARYSREADEQNRVYRHFTASDWNSFPKFIAPTRGKFSNSFGRKRFFNGEARAPHSGLDIPAPNGQLVVAPADGVIVQSGDYFFNGKTILIDHGQGMVSMLCHLSSIDVTKGQRVKQGEAIAKVGSTGRVTGAHLHWGLSLNDARVDPQLVLVR